MSVEKCRTKPPQRCETELERKVDERAELPDGVATPEEGAGDSERGV